MNCLHNNRIDNLISDQWDRNAQIRLEELSSGKDRTYKNILCPVFYNILKGISPGGTVLDVGCGLGFFSKYIQERGFDVTGVDMAPQCISIARRNFPSLKLFNENIVEFSKNRHQLFDACVANMLFHNVPNVEEVAAGIASLLKPQGVLVGCIPHPLFWFERRRAAAKEFSVNGNSAYLTPFKIRGLSEHPALFTYFHRDCDEYWEAFARAGLTKLEAASFEQLSWLPNDIVFFIAKKI